MSREVNANLINIKWNADGLVPVVVQDVESREVLMLAYMNEEALNITLAEGQACYYSRSRQTLWRKGETSGHRQEVVELCFDCDQDAILLTVRQMGMACHENYFSCFHYHLRDDEFQAFGEPEVRPETGIQADGPMSTRLSLGPVLEELAAIIHIRNSERPEGAYTTYLFEKGLDKILKKVGEECAEVIIAAKNPDKTELRYEAADLLYHLLVLLEEQGVGLDQISRELLGRRK